MEILVILIFVVILVGILLIIFAEIYNKFQTYIIRINEAEADIDSVLRKRFDLLNRSVSVIRGNIETDKEVLEIIVKLRSRKLTNFELDRILYEAINEFNTYKEEYPSLNKVETFLKIAGALNESETEIYALRKYYNEVITNYNKLMMQIPSNLIGLIFKYKIKNYFDGKNMADEVYNDFKL